LSRNNLDGSLPVELFANPPLSLVLDFSHNNLTGELPLGFGTHGGDSGPVSLHMEGNKFYGEIPATWNLIWTQQINLSYNDLSGTVPEFFAFLPELEQLDLSYNNLEGAVPTSGIFENTTAVVLNGNKGLCSNSSMVALPICPGISASVTKTKHHLSLLATLLLIVLPPPTIGFLVLLWFLPTLWKKGMFSFSQWDVLSKILSCFSHHKRREVQAAPCQDENKLKRVSYQDILKATNWFSSFHTISSTCTGSVYVVRFKSDRSLVAIKVFNLSEPGGYDSYFIECEVLRSTRHRNIMRPVTLCSTLDSQNHEFKALIFEFMVNGSLERWLHSEHHNEIPDKVLSFRQRICIGADVASALDYVHNQLTPPLIHCDLKPQNILLDNDMTARLSDFGSAKFLSPGLAIPESLDDVGGTIGYMAPGESAFPISHLSTVCRVHIRVIQCITSLQSTGWVARSPQEAMCIVLECFYWSCLPENDQPMICLWMDLAFVSSVNPCSLRELRRF
jgi:hypothetical protein